MDAGSRPRAAGLRLPCEPCSGTERVRRRITISIASKSLSLFVRSQRALSRAFDHLLPSKYRKDGNRDYIVSFVPAYLRNGMTVYEIGGGKSPLTDLERKRAMGLTVVGIDIDQAELSLAPPGAYDKAICTDICDYRGEGDADLVICQAVLEHVHDVGAAFECIASVLKPGGVALLFTPSRNALFAQLNRVLPQNAKKSILYGIAPQTRAMQGFRAYYDRCTPRDFRRLAKANGLVVKEERFYYISSYFACFFPAYVLWRAWILLSKLLIGDQAAETFSMALKKLE